MTGRPVPAGQCPQASARRPFKGVSSVWFESAPFTSALFETVQVVKLETEEKIAMVDEKADVVKAELLSEHARSVAEMKTFIETRRSRKSLRIADDKNFAFFTPLN
jgi:hypothetical protein